MFLHVSENIGHGGYGTDTARGRALKDDARLSRSTFQIVFVQPVRAAVQFTVEKLHDIRRAEIGVKFRNAAKAQFDVARALLDRQKHLVFGKSGLRHVVVVIVFEQGAVFQRGKILIVFAIEREKPLGRDRLVQFLPRAALFGRDRFENFFVEFAAAYETVRRIKIARYFGRKNFADERFVFLQNVLYLFPPVFFHFRIRIPRGKILKRIVLTDEIKYGKGLQRVTAHPFLHSFLRFGSLLRQFFDGAAI